MINKKEILKHIKSNNWLNGYYDMKDGDVMAMVCNKEYLDELHNIQKLKKLYNLLYDGVMGIYKYKNLIFANHWNYGTFVYYLNNKDNSIKEFEHLTMSAYKEEEFLKDIGLMNKGEWFNLPNKKE